MKFGTAVSLLLAGTTSLSGRTRLWSQNSRTFASAFTNVVALQNSSKSTLFGVSSPSKTSPFLTNHQQSSMTTALNSAVSSAETKSAPVEVFRSDYKPLPYTIRTMNMEFDIMDGKTTVTSEMIMVPNPKSDGSTEMVLDGDETCVKLLSLQMNGKDLTEGVDYSLAPGSLTLHGSAFHNKDNNTLRTVVEIVPEDNTQLSGLYKSGPMYCSQCEAMGFRRITYYPDRPDVMAVFERVTIIADKSKYPVLLSNGNRVMEETTTTDDDRHRSVWTDPFPKPSYLFCVVAGDLKSISDTYTTSSGKEVHCEIFSEKENVNKLDYAMDSLKRSMKWDEDTFGLEYDLNLYNIVAVNDFNMGAMENKGLNVFNTAYVLADPKTASDLDYERVEGVIGHEYFHNWTGNRVTCRDWFQLTLKEGLTVYRDQQFSGDMNSNAVNRIENVKGLRARQFNEDAGPMSHPIRPDSYISMDNFYTATVYVKGAEVIRMYDTLLGSDGFRKGMDLYFERHDGDAVTCDDFRNAMADANDVDLSQFARWYSTPGTPTVSYSDTFDKENGVYTLTLTQTSKSTEGPLHIPVSVGLLDKETGREVKETMVLELTQDTQSFTFEHLDGEVVPSLLRGFSAPVKLVPENKDTADQDTAFLAAHDTDDFNKWEAGQRLYTSAIFGTMDDVCSDYSSIFEVFSRTLKADTTDYSIQAYALSLPTEGTLAEDLAIVEPQHIRQARNTVKKAIAKEYYDDILSLYNSLTADMDGLDFKVDATNNGRRRLRNTLLDYLCCLKDTETEQITAATLATTHFEKASGMTDKMAALSALASMDGAGETSRDAALKSFYEEADGDALVLNKWFMVQAMSGLPDVLDRVKALTSHPDFTLSNPNRARSLISAFTMNSAPFHDESGEGYTFLGDIIAQLDKLNPQVSSRTATSLIQWRRYNEKRGAMMKKELEKLKAMEGISDDLFEIVGRGLKD